MTRCDAPGSYLDAVEENLRMMHNHGSRNTLPFNDTGHPARSGCRGPSMA
jgi:hypothetical protein